MPRMSVKEMKLIEKYLRRGLSDTEAKRRARADMVESSKPKSRKSRKK